MFGKIKTFLSMVGLFTVRVVLLFIFIYFLYQKIRLQKGSTTIENVLLRVAEGGAVTRFEIDGKCYDHTCVSETKGVR